MDKLVNLQHSLCSARFPKEYLFTLFAKEKKLPADIVFTLILPFRLLRTQEPEIGNESEVIIYSGSIIIHVQDLIEKCVLLYHSRVLLLLNSYHHHSYK